MLWSGMAKETAHQIGTPLTSLMGWLELLKTSSNKDQYLKEVEKDLERLNIISKGLIKLDLNLSSLKKIFVKKLRKP